MIIWLSSAARGRNICGTQDVSAQLQRAGLVVNAAKCHFGQKEVSYLGDIIGGGSIRQDPKKLQAIAEYLRPRRMLKPT